MEPVVLNCLLAGLLVAAGVGVVGDSSSSSTSWQEACPKECKCKWVSGKRTAECQGGNLDTFPKFNQPDKIQVLHMTDNPLGSLPEKVFFNLGMINLQKVYLTNCSIGHIHATAFNSLIILIELDLSHNAIRTLELGTFDGNIRIRKLWLGHNPIRTLHSYSFPVIPHLKTVDLSNGLLTKLGRSTFVQLEYLEVLHLNDNKFRRLDKRIFQPMKGLKSLTLEGNPWQCDCR